MLLTNEWRIMDKIDYIENTLLMALKEVRKLKDFSVSPEIDNNAAKMAIINRNKNR